jgi:hypothetical protein
MSPRPDRGQTLANAPLEDLLTILLRQFKRPLASKGVSITDADAVQIASAVSKGDAETETQRAIRTALVDLIAESEGVLAQWNLSFEQALDTPMDALPGWETTADFLEIANDKSNAELRISAGAALLLALGDDRHAGKLAFLVQRDPNDTDAQIAARMLAFVRARGE